VVARGVLVQDEREIPVLPFSGACVVKPNSGGSSVGVTILADSSDEIALKNAVVAALADGSDALIEELISGCEVTAAIVGEGEYSRALPLVEIVPQGEGFYDYAAKYAAGGSRHLIPPRLSTEAQNATTEAALRVHRALGCRGVARSDFIVTESGTPYFLEINTLPGMTATSLVPDAARAAGLEFSELVETLVRDALESETQPQ
jgi:D-alanine-D-alanine ligase